MMTTEMFWPYHLLVFPKARFLIPHVRLCPNQDWFASYKSTKGTIAMTWPIK
jgi:hypothetical protein